jgi:hypothetical protein
MIDLAFAGLDRGAAGMLDALITFVAALPT